MINLDYIAAKYAGRVKVQNNEGIEDTATSALNILHEQGIYAVCIWLLEKRDQKGKNDIISGLNELFHDAAVPIHFLPGHRFEKPDDVREELTQNLKTMFFAKDIIELFLVYVRHLAKADKP